MKKLRKIFTVSVMAVTVMSMSMIVAPAAEAAQAGDLVKLATNSAVYYLGADSKKHVFPNEATYFTWYSDWSGIQVVSQSELDEFARGGNVTVRPGTRLITSPDEAIVYAVEADSTLRSIVSAENAINLWGADWAKNVIDIVPSFMSNYVTGSPLSLGQYPEGSLIKTADSPDVYYVDAAGLARKFASAAAFLANNLKWDDIVTAAAIPAAGTMINSEETAISTIQFGAGTGIDVGAGSGLTVVLSGDTPSSVSIPSGGTLVPFMRINLTAASDGDVTVKSIKLVRVGTGATTDFTGGYLYDGDTRLTTIKSVNSSTHELSFSGLSYVVPAGATKILTVRMSGATGDKSGNHAFRIVSASDITTNGATISGSFPIQSNTMTFSTVDAATVTLTASDDLPDVKVGEQQSGILDFDIENNAYEVVNIYSIKLKQNGTASDGDLNNFSLELDGVKVVEGVSMVSKYVTFMLDEPVAIKKSKKITAVVRADVITGVTKTVQLYLNNIADIDARGSAYGDHYSATVTNTSLNTTYADDVTIDGAAINVSFDGPQAADVKDNNDDMLLANFKIKADTEDVEISTMRIVVTMDSSDADDILDNVEMVDDVNGVSYSVADNTSASVTQNYDFENVSLKSGIQYTFKIRGDVPDAATVGQSYTASIDFGSNFTATYVNSDEAVTAADDISSQTLTGKTMTVAEPTVTFAKVTTSAATYVENSDKVLLYKGKITANGVSDLKLSKVNFTATLGAGYLDDYFERLYLYTVADDLAVTPLATVTSLADVTAASFSGFNLTIPKGTSNGVEIVVRGDVKNDPTANTVKLAWTYGGATTTLFTVKDADNDALTYTSPSDSQYTISSTVGQTSTIAALGTYTVAVDTDFTGLNANQNVLAGTSALVGRLKLTAAKEDVKIEDITLINLTGDADADDISALKLYSDSAMTTLLGSATLDSSRRATFEDINVEVPTTGITYWYVGADLAGIDYSDSPASDSTATAARTIELAISSTTDYTVKALGVATGDVELDNGVASSTNTNVSTIVGAKVSAVSSAFANGLLANGTAKDIFSFKVTVPASDNADYDGSNLGVKLATTTFTVASSADVVLATFKLERVGGADGEQDALYHLADDDAATVVDVSAGTFKINFPETYSDTDSDLTIRPGETAEYVVKATVSGVGANDSLQVTMEGLTANLNYTHNTGSAGSDTADISAVYTLLPGITYVRGGSLTN
ncbi:MAG: hypothetical protein ABH881_00300 [bacterium]